MKKISTYNNFINEGFDISVGEYADVPKSAEIKSAKKFKWTPTPVTVKDIEADIVDDYNTSVDIDMSNGDVIEYHLSERRRQAGDGGAPPFYDVHLKINGNVLETDLEWMSDFGTNSIVGTVLAYYSNWKTKNQMK